MRRAVAGIWDVPSGKTVVPLAVTAVCFFLGGLLGCALAANVSGGGADGLTLYLNGFLTLAASDQGVAGPALLPLVWDVMRWPLFTAILGFTAIGLVLIPALFCVRGFLLSFAITSFMRALGGAGGLMALAVFGVSGLVSIPALFVLGVQGLTASRRLAGRSLGETARVSPFGKAYFLRCGVCIAAFFVCVLLEYWAVPALVSGMAGLL